MLMGMGEVVGMEMIVVMSSARFPPSCLRIRLPLDPFSAPVNTMVTLGAPFRIGMAC